MNYMDFNDLFKLWLHLKFLLIRKILLIKFEDTFHTGKAKNIHIHIHIKFKKMLSGSYNRGEKKCCTGPHMDTHFWKKMIRPIKSSRQDV